MQKAAIILPTYNEARNITKLIDAIVAVTRTTIDWEVAIVVVDSSSPDGTGAIVEKLCKSNTQKYEHLHIIHTKKEGLGKAYLEGFATTLEKLKPDVLFEMDADFSHDPAMIPVFLKQIEQGADFVIGSRYMPGGAIPPDWGIDRKFLSIVGNWVIRLGFMKMSITEWTNGYRAFRSWVVKKHMNDLRGYTGYVFQVAFLDKAIKSGARICEIPIKFKDRTEGVSKINSGQYMSQTLLYVLTQSPFIKFCFVGGIGFIVDFGFASLFIYLLNIPKVASNMMSAEIAIISNFMFNNYWSFAHKKIKASTSLLVNLLKFNVVSSGSILIQGVGMWFALTLFGDHLVRVTNFSFHSWILYKVLIILCIIIPYSYILYNKVVWKEQS